MAQIATTIEQSKTLIDLGLNANTADMYYHKCYSIDGGTYNLSIPSNSGFKNKHFFDDCPDEIPSWSLSALIELMPEHIVINNKVSNSLKMDKEEGGTGFCYFFSAFDKVDDIVMCDMTPINAAFEMICYLLKNKLI